MATHRVQVRTDEDRSSVRAWRFMRCFSAWDAEAVEVVGAELQVLFHVVGWLVGSDVIVMMRPHIAYVHNEPCATLARHFCDNLGRFVLKDDKGRHTLRPFAMSYTILQYSTVLPFTFVTFSNLF